MPSMMPVESKEPTIFVIDDEAHIGGSLVNLFESTQRKAVSFLSANEFLANLSSGASGCILLDIQMPDMTGLELQSRLVEAGNPLPVVFMTGNGSVSIGVSAMKAGAFDFLLKPFNSDAVLAVTDKAIARDAEYRKELSRREKIQACKDRLTPREAEVLDFVTQGLMNKQIAHEMNISEIMVKLHRGRMMKKMEARSIVEIVRMYDLVAITPWSHAAS